MLDFNKNIIYINKYTNVMVSKNDYIFFSEKQKKEFKIINAVNLRPASYGCTDDACERSYRKTRNLSILTENRTPP